MAWVTAKISSSLVYILKRGGVKEGHVQHWVSECFKVDKDVSAWNVRAQGQPCCLMAIFETDTEYENLSEAEKQHLNVLIQE